MKTHSTLIAITVLGALAGCRSNKHTVGYSSQDIMGQQARGELHAISSLISDSTFHMGVWQLDSVKYELHYDSIDRPTVTITARRATSRRLRVDTHATATQSFDSTVVQNRIKAVTDTYTETRKQSETKPILPYQTLVLALIIVVALIWIKIRK